MEKPSLREKQIASLTYYMMNPRGMDLSDPGTGKTPPVCVYIYWLWTNKQVKTVWAMPKSLMKKNRDELLRFTHFQPEDIVIIGGSKESREKAFRSDAKVFLITFTSYGNYWEQLKQLQPQLDATVVDEFHMGFSTNDSKRTQALYASMKQITYFLPMTGTLIDGRLSSAYPAINIIEPRYYGSYGGFLGQHALVDEYGKIVAWQNHAKLAEIFKRHAIRWTFEEIHGKTAKVIINEPVEMHPKQREAYDEFEETALLELEDMWLDAPNDGVALIRARQIMAHPHKYGILPETELTGKEERLMVHLEDCKQSGKPMIVFAALVPEQERCVKLAERLGLKVGLINGDVSGSKRGQLDEAFQAGKLDVMVASPATASVGFNWGHVDTIVFASLDYKDSNFVQAYRRAIRGKRENKLLIYILEYENSIDQKIFHIIEYKSGQAHMVDDTQEKLVVARREPKEPKVKDLNINGKISMTDFIK